MRGRKISGIIADVHQLEAVLTENGIPVPDEGLPVCLLLAELPTGCFLWWGSGFSPMTWWKISVQVAGSLRYMQKPIQNPYGHGKRPDGNALQGTENGIEKTSGSVVAQRLQTLKQNREQQEKTNWEELVRMRSPVQIWIAAPKTLEIA